MLSCPVPAYSSWNRCCRRAQEALWQKGWWNGLWSVRLYHFITFKFGDIKGLVVLLFLGHYIYIYVITCYNILRFKLMFSHAFCLSMSRCFVFLLLWKKPTSAEEATGPGEENKQTPELCYFMMVYSFPYRTTFFYRLLVLYVHVMLVWIFEAQLNAGPEFYGIVDGYDNDHPLRLVHLFQSNL